MRRTPRGFLIFSGLLVLNGLFSGWGFETPCIQGLAAFVFAGMVKAGGNHG